MSARQLSQASGVSREQLNALETGQLDASYELLVDVAKGLGAQPSELVIFAEQADFSTDS